MAGLRNIGMRRVRWHFLPVWLLVLIAISAPGADVPAQEVWTFDRIDRIGGYATLVLGQPRVIDTRLGKARMRASKFATEPPTLISARRED